ncbi:hypothetical protein A8C56_02705 [Niabella ginsenosidivorans]|uniref:Uncharacterized protein n=1 Tax=Niabella ginsenosidivorans TaxID=1176587 RepID=A0A1A9I0F4_9BACT|nr:hypothetical protein [Niabella ginsenosidivorans]ANH80034.1 hypothetical protein A8C56_02705 [Niabella ginsenosidivorans]
MRKTIRAVPPVIVFFTGMIHGYSQNLLNLGGWVPGTGAVTAFAINGVATENQREWGSGPGGNRVVVWKAIPNGGNDADGGWNSTAVSIDAASMYRLTVWIKKLNSNDGTTYFGCSQNNVVTALNGTANNNPYFWVGDLPELDKWYLLVGYVHGSGDSSLVSMGGVYDGVTGAKVSNCTDFKFAAGAAQLVHRAYLYYDPNTSDRQFFYGPRIEQVNGNEPSIATLLGSLGTGAAGATNFSGKVGILTSDPGDYALAVKGKLRAQEIKVDAPANWPDYVFEKGHQKMTLEELAAYVKANKHLPGIPGAEEVKEKGIDLAEMNRLLLEKIEELTLYLIKQGKTIQELKNTQ